MHRVFAFVLLSVLLPALPAAASAPLPVTVSVPPQAYLVERIGGERVDVSVMIESGSSPHTFSLAPRRLQELAAARVFVKVGHPDFAFERRFLRHVEDGDRDVEVVDMVAGVDLMALPAHAHGAGDAAHAGEGDHHDDGHDDHAHGGGDHGHGEHHDGEHGHAHGDTDPHVWVAPSIMRATAARVADALARADPEGEPTYRARLDAFHRELDTLEASIRERLDPLAQRRFVVNHPGWGYFARDFDLEQVAIESGGREPSPAQLARLIDAARAKGVRVIFVQQGFSERSARVIAREVDADVVTADPLARDWAANLRRFARALEEGLRQ